MSKYLIILLLITNLFSQIKFDHGFGIEIADKEDYTIKEHIQVGNSSGYREAIGEYGNIATVYQLRSYWKNISIIFDTIIYTKLSNFGLAPITSLFDSEIRYSFKEFYSISLEHRCVHPIINDGKRYDLIYGGYNIKLKLHYNME